MTMPDGLKTVRIELWPLAADEVGIWLLDADAWRSPLPVESGTPVQHEVDLLLAQHGVSTADTAMTHSTSWRSDGPAVVLTYVAVINCPGPIRGHWPDARPVGDGLAHAVGRPAPHAPTAAPTPRYVDVLYHSIRHLAFLVDTDETNAEAMGERWRTHLDQLRPELAGMYRTDQAA